MILRDVAPEDEIALAKGLAPHTDEIWIVEDLKWAGGIAQMAAILEATRDTDVVVAHGIAPAPFRNPAALAMEWAALERMYPGRLHLGIGHGLPEWMAQLGERVASPLTLLRETIEAVRELLAGNPVKVNGRYVQINDVTLTFPPAQRPVLSAGVTGPKSLHLSGAVADGTIIPEGFDAEAVAAAKAHIDAGRADADRSEPHRLTVFVGFYCGDLAELPPPPPHMDEVWGVVGPDVDAVLPELQAVVDAGADCLVIVPWGPDPVQQMALVQSQIQPRLSLPG